MKKKRRNWSLCLGGCGKRVRDTRCRECYVRWARSPEGRRWHADVQADPEVKAKQVAGVRAAWKAAHGEEWRRRLAEAISGDNNPMRRPEIAAKLSGEKNPAWRGGVSFEPYGLGWTPTLRESIRERDSYSCAVCGGFGRCVHHKDYDKKNNDPSNLVTLCKAHHDETTVGDRGYWQAYLTGTGYAIYLGAC